MRPLARAAQAAVMSLALAGCAAPALLPPIQAPAAAYAAWELRCGPVRASAVPVACASLPGGLSEVVFLTARHAVGHGPMSVVLRGSRLDHGVVLAAHPELDAALIAFAAPLPIRTIEMRGSPARIGEDAWVAGYGGGTSDLWVSRGVVSARNRASVQIVPGDSGGAVLDAAGALLGIVSTVNVHRVPWSPYPQAAWHQCAFVPVAAVLGWARKSLAEAGL